MPYEFGADRLYTVDKIVPEALFEIICQIGLMSASRTAGSVIIAAVSIVQPILNLVSKISQPLYKKRTNVPIAFVIAEVRDSVYREGDDEFNMKIIHCCTNL